MTYLLAYFLTTSSAIDLSDINTASIEAKIIPYNSYGSHYSRMDVKGQALPDILLAIFILF